MWDTEMVVLLRHMIGDLDPDDYTYTDDRLQQTILTSAIFVTNEIPFDTEYIIDVDGVSLTPDPTDRDADTRDTDFMTLVLLKAACFIDTSEARTAAGQAITIRDGSSMISLGGSGGVLQGRLTLWQKGYCATYQEAKAIYMYKNSATGQAVSGPLPGVSDWYFSRYR